MMPSLLYINKPPCLDCNIGDQLGAACLDESDSICDELFNLPLERREDQEDHVVGSQSHLHDRFSRSDGHLFMNKARSPSSNFSPTQKKVRFQLPVGPVPTREQRRSTSAGSGTLRRRRSRAVGRSNSDSRWEPFETCGTIPPPPEGKQSPTMPTRRKSVEKVPEKLEAPSLVIPVRRRSADQREKVSSKPLNMPTRRVSDEQDFSTADLLKFALSELATCTDQLNAEDREYLEDIQTIGSQ